jgi:RNA polymerase sigma-70 factor, ECF subfamily
VPSPSPRPKAPEAGLGIVDQLGLDGFRYLHATRAELLRRLGRTDDGAERRFLERRLTELAATTGAG